MELNCRHIVLHEELATFWVLSNSTEAIKYYTYNIWGLLGQIGAVYNSVLKIILVLGSKFTNWQGKYKNLRGGGGYFSIQTSFNKTDETKIK